MLASTNTRTAAFLAALALFGFGGAVATAQRTTLADVVPATCVLYLREEDPIGRIEKWSGNPEVWSDPKKTSARTRREMEKTFRQADRHIGKDEGTMDGWLRSIGSIEIALFSLSFDFGGMGDGPPFSMDFAVSFESPAAIEMFDTMGAMLIDQGQATRTDKGNYVISLGGGMEATLGVHEGRIIMASSQDRLGSITEGLKAGGVPSPLSSDPTYRACTGESASPSLFFVRFGPLLTLIRDGIPDRAQKRMDEVMIPLGLNKITGIGYFEKDNTSIVIAKASEAINAFKLLKGKQAPPDLIARMPADCLFAAGRTDEFGPQVLRIQKYLTDPLTFPFHKDVARGLEELNRETGLTVDGFGALLKGSVVVAWVPDEHGAVDEEHSTVVAAKVATREEALALFAQITTGAKSRGLEAEQTEADGTLWLRVRMPAAAGGAEPPVEPGSDAAESRAASIAARRAARMAADRQRPQPVVAWNGEAAVMGLEPNVKRTLSALAGKVPTLGGTNAFRRLPPKATFYVTTCLKSAFATENEFAAAFSALKNLGSTATSVVVEDDILTTVSNMTASESIATILTAAAMGEDGRDAQSEVLAQLTEIGSRTRAYKEQNGKWPASMQDLGYTGKDLPSAKDLDGKVHAMVFLPPKDSPDGWRRDLLAYFPSGDYGRLAVSTDGTARRWSESDFLGALARYNSPAGK